MPGIHIPSDVISSDSSNTFSSESPPSYTVMENGNGELVNPCLQVEWPTRPIIGRYSDEEHRHYKMLRKKLNRKQPPETKVENPSSVETTMLYPKEAYQYISSTWLQTDDPENYRPVAVVPSQLLVCDDQSRAVSAYASQTELSGSSGSAFNIPSTMDVASMSSARSQSFASSSGLVSSALTGTSSASLSGQPFKNMGPSKREAALEYLRDFRAVIYYDIEMKNQGHWKMAFNGRKGVNVYDIAPTKLFADGTHLWGIVTNETTPRVAFCSINQLAAFYCNYPDALAFSTNENQ